MNWYEEHYIGDPIVVMCYQYDSYGNMIKYTDGKNQVTEFKDFNGQGLAQTIKSNATPIEWTVK